ncbi:proto-oncogene Mas-like [Anolis sagrei]|uniref:proto-oncogene Mas-like n=1 Tax=Anolis sagrei TaxID=38937 RepID=UPI00351F89E4
MRSVLALNHEDKEPIYRGVYSTCNGSNVKDFSEAEKFYDQLFSIAFLSKPNSTMQVIFIFISFISIVGMVGNGFVIWLLGFCIQRNNFTIYVLNLAIADFSLLMNIFVSLVIKRISLSSGADIITMQLLLAYFVLFTHSVGLYLLTAIGVERCISVLFPIWARCHRPTYLSTTVSVLCWIVPAFMLVTTFLLHYFCLLGYWVIYVRTTAAISLFIFTPIMVISTLILFIKVLFRHQPGKLHTMILIILLFFIFTAVPNDILYFLFVIDPDFHIIALPIMFLLIVLNSSINPIVYFFVKNGCNCRSWESIKVMLQRVFKEDSELT